MKNMPSGIIVKEKKENVLQPDTKFFDGYWHPDIDINRSPYQIGWVN